MRRFSQWSVSLALAAVLAALPAAGAVCLGLCVPPAPSPAVTDAEARPASCHEPAGGAVESRLSGSHGCDRHNAPDHGAVRSLTPGRAWPGHAPLASRIAAALPHVFSHAAAHGSARRSFGVSPPRSTLASGAPLVLRI